MEINMKDNIKKVLELLQDKNQFENIEKIDDYDKFLEYLKTNNIVLSKEDKEELSKIMSEIRDINIDCLDDDDLKNVTGGVKWDKATAAAGSAVFGTYGALVGWGIKKGKQLADKYYRWEQNCFK